MLRPLMLIVNTLISKPTKPPARAKTTNISRAKEHKNLDAHIASAYNNHSAGVAETADAADLKSAGEILVGSSPTLGII